MTDKYFNLVDEPWLPVRLVDGSVTELGLLEAYKRSQEIKALAETSPPNLVAQYRLLLAILNRAITSAYPDRNIKYADRAKWFRDGLPKEAVAAYLENWYERFWLFHPEQPFMQVADLKDLIDDKDRKPWTQLDLAKAKGDNTLLFDNNNETEPSPTTPQHAIRCMLGNLQFATSGTIKILDKKGKSDVKCALTNTAAFISIGKNLNETLALCLHTPPISKTKGDLPTWEQKPLTVSELLSRKEIREKLVTGTNDLYTRQSRSILLSLEDDYSVLFLRYAEGNRLPDLPQRFIHDPMIAVKKKGKQNYSAVTFTEGKALWRDLLTLPRNEDYEACQFITDAANLRRELNLDSDKKVILQPFLVAGVTAEQGKPGKLKLWRHIQTILPLALDKSVEELLYDNIADLVNDAQKLFNDISELAIKMIKTVKSDKNDKKAHDHAKKCLDASPFSTCYFTVAERSLYKSLELLYSINSAYQPPSAQDKNSTEQTTEDEYDANVREAKNLWYQALKKGAENAWDLLFKSMGTSPRVLRAYAKFFPEFEKTVRGHDPKLYQ